MHIHTSERVETKIEVGQHQDTSSSAASEAEQKGFQRDIIDYKHRATACERAGLSRAEANAHFAMGVLHDNLAQHGKAVKSYKRFRAALQDSDDTFAEALAHNSIGVSYQVRIMLLLRVLISNGELLLFTVEILML